MLRSFLISKIHRANVTQRDLNYVGSITIDTDLLNKVGMLANEKVEVYNISNGNRFHTYIIPGEAGSGIIGVNGAAARLVSVGDKVIIVTYGLMAEEEFRAHKPKVLVITDEQNHEYYLKD
ncbi:MAG: aspartate 1-decarboxylase [Candidatus Cloacimonetes bacterium]|nr:aspartate 1-decarboxylase [Candidatus Cloacimonadota bacterium]